MRMLGLVPNEEQTPRQLFWGTLMSGAIAIVLLIAFTGLRGWDIVKSAAVLLAVVSVGVAIIAHNRRSD